LIVSDRKRATSVALSLLSLFFLGTSVGSADPTPGDPAALPSVSVNFIRGDVAATYPTRAHTVAEFIQERGIDPAADDFLSAPPDQTIASGMTIEYRPAVPIVLLVGNERRWIRSSAASVGEMLAATGVKLGPNDEVYPASDARVAPQEIVHVVRVAVWTKKLHSAILPPVHRRFDASLEEGTLKTADAGRSGIREVIVRFTKRGDDLPTHALIASRIIRAPRPKVILLGVGEYLSLARFAKVGFEGAVKFFGSAMHMVATAYSATCYGCSGSGLTAIGVRAGHGIVAVDPSVIPLGTKLYIPGYGPALAGDTGGAINGRRIDLGFNNEQDAQRFGRQAVTVYVLR
jgi:3D (Asp-Asp-Asp) domain-containing protein